MLKWVENLRFIEDFARFYQTEGQIEIKILLDFARLRVKIEMKTLPGFFGPRVKICIYTTQISQKFDVFEYFARLCYTLLDFARLCYP